MAMAFLFTPKANAQLILTPDTSICVGSCVTLEAQASTSAEMTFTDDIYGPTIPLPFTFQFYGTNYDIIALSSNGYLQFRTTPSTTTSYSAWSIGTGIPGNTNVLNSVMGFYADLYPVVAGSSIKYTTVGVAPNRAFVVMYCNVAMFSCTSMKATFQIILHETTNEIEFQILNAPLCSSWNSGYAIQGVQNASGTAATFTPGRNYPTNWSASNDGKHYTPSGTTSYVVTDTPFSMVPFDPTVSWYANGTTLVGTGPTISVCPTVTTFYVAVPDTTGCVVSALRDTVWVYVLPPSDEPAVADISYCVGDAAGPLTAGGTSLEWYDSPTGPPLGGAPVPSTTTPGDFTWYVSQIEPGGCRGPRAPIVVHVLAPPVVSVTPHIDTICLGESTILTATGAENYSWEPATGLSDAHSATPTATPNVTTTYVVYGSMADSVCAPGVDSATIYFYVAPTVTAGPDDTTCLGTPIQLFGAALPTTQEYDYSWTGAGGISPADASNPYFDPPATGTFTLYLTATPVGGNSCPGFDTVQIYVLPNDITLNTTDTTVCQGACVQVSATGHDLFSYLWSPSAGISNPTAIAPLICPPTADTFHYTLTASYPNCPDINKYLTITVEPQPSVFLGPDREKCQWDTLHLHAQVSPADYSAYTYLWSPDSVLSAVNTPNVIFSSDDSAMVLVSVSTPHGCSAKDSMAVFTHSGNFAALLPAQDTGICPGASVPLLASGGVFYQWSPAYFLSDPQSGSTVATPTADVAYTVLVTDQYGCYDTLGIAIDVRPAAVVDLGDSIDLYPGDSIRMDPKGNALYFSWFPHLGLSNPNIANPVAMPSVNTRYFVNATTEWGCTTTDSVDVIVHLDSELDMPNAFVPGNGPNGQIKAVHLGIAELKYLRIFNRWGQKVFETSDINAGWDGTLNGKPQPMGVYIYTVEGKTFRGKTVKKQGNITLIR